MRKIELHSLSRLTIAIATLFVLTVAVTTVHAAESEAAPSSEKPVGAPHAEALGWRLGCQAYSFNRFTFFEAIDKVASLGLKVIEAYPGQRFSLEKPDAVFDQNMSAELQAEALAKLEAAGVDLVAFGVVGLKNDETEARKIFDFAKAMGIEIITAEPEEDAFDLLDKLVEEYKISVAIHNHPEPSRYWNPEKVVEVTSGHSARIGACADTGHWMRSGVKPVDALKTLEGRIISFHLKDLNEFGNREAHDIPWGTGQADIKAILEEVKRQGLKPVFSVEYEYNWENSVPDIAQCVAFFDQVAAELQTDNAGKPKKEK